VIIRLADAGRLNKGDILVTSTTSPPWTPLFAIAGTIVTDTGGALNHCSIVAREYGIPAAVGVSMATAVIKDGDQIEVDGDTVTVRIL
jgi:pyruvate,water dikinase